MSTTDATRRRAPRKTAKPAEEPATPAVPADVAPAYANVTSPDQPSADAADVTVEQTTEPAAESTTEPATEKHHKKSQLSGVDLAPARVRRHLDKLTLNAELLGQLSTLKASLAKFNQAKSLLETGKLEDGTDASDEQKAAAQATLSELESKVPELEARAKALSREKVRFSSNASNVLTVVCDEMVKQLLRHSMKAALASKHKIIKVTHVHSEGVESLSLYPLFSRLPSFQSNSKDLSEKDAIKKHELLLKQALSQAEKDFKKKYGVKGRGGAPKQPAETTEEPTHEVEDEVSAGADDDKDSKKSFRHYMYPAKLALIAENPSYAGIRVSAEIKEYLSDLVIEFIKRLAPLIALTTRSMENKTVNEVSIMRTVESLMIDGHSPSESLEVRDGVDPSRKQPEEQPAGPAFHAVRSVAYPTSGFGALECRVSAVLDELKKASTEAAAQKAEPTA